MRFNYEAYEKVFPKDPEPSKPIESAVDTFKPTEEEMAMDKPGVKINVIEEPKLDEIPEPEGIGALAPEGEENG